MADPILEFAQYATNRVDFVWTDDDDVPIDITGATAKMQLRRRAGWPVLYEPTGAELVVNGPAGTVHLVTDKDALNSAIWRRARFDLLVTKAGERDRLVKGRIELTPGITVP